VFIVWNSCFCVHKHFLMCSYLCFLPIYSRLHSFFPTALSFPLSIILSVSFLFSLKRFPIFWCYRKPFSLVRSEVTLLPRPLKSSILKETEANHQHTPWRSIKSRLQDMSWSLMASTSPQQVQASMMTGFPEFIFRTPDSFSLFLYTYTVCFRRNGKCFRRW
jgi:hypothetical protein